jgi:competence protein ComEA
MWKKFVQDYLTFTRQDRIGLFAILFLLALAFLLPRFFPKKDQLFLEEHEDALVMAIDSVSTDRSEQPNFSPEPSVRTVKPSLFAFDPNTLDEKGWEKLGLPPRVAKTILKYRSKGGQFRRPEDLQKIWSLPEGFYDRVAPYIQIAGKPSDFVSQNRNEIAHPESKPFVREERKISMVNINDADTSAWIALPGIGSKLAMRIVNFRDKLGGFYSVQQVAETYGVQDSVFQKIKNRLVLTGEVKKLNVNTATKDELKTHPYIRWQLANAIVEYRTQHGAFKTAEDLKKIAMVDEALLQKLTPYLSF